MRFLCRRPEKCSCLAHWFYLVSSFRPRRCEGGERYLHKQPLGSQRNSSAGDFQAKATRGRGRTPKAATKGNQAFPANFARGALECDASAHRCQSERPFPTRETQSPSPPRHLRHFLLTFIGDLADFP